MRMRKTSYVAPGKPLLHPDHKVPVTRRDFLARGFITGTATIAAPSIFGLFADPRAAHAALDADIQTLAQSCGVSVAGAGKIPFICFDLAGGGNIAGSNVLVGGQGGQMDFLSTAGYNKLGLPGNMIPTSSTTNFVNSSMGLAFHSDSAFLRGMQTKATTTTAAATNGAVIPAYSENDTGTNPHNPMYGIHGAGADGSLLTLIGTQSSPSGGNSMAPAYMMDAKFLPTKISTTRDCTGLVNTGQLVAPPFTQSDAVAVLQSIERVSAKKVPLVTQDMVVQNLVQCGYVKTADLVDRYGNPSALDPTQDTDINAIFSNTELNDSDFQKTAAVMKLVIDGYAGAGTIEMGGFDYHTGDRATGEARDMKAGICMGACLEYAARRGVPLMLYVFSDGSVVSSGMTDNSAGGRGKGVWTSDNQSTASAFFLVYNPQGRAQLYTGGTNPAARHQQIGFFNADGSVNTSSSPAANAVNLLAETVILNYMALHGRQANFKTAVPASGLSSGVWDNLIAFNPIVSGTIA